jgi:RNA recognition motif-containing protein
MNIFVAKLNFKTTNDGLRDAFAEFGDVDSANVIMDRETGRSKGFGFVEMPDDKEAKAAIAKLDGVELDGSTIVVKEATPRGDDRKSGGGGGGFNRGGGGGGGFNRGGGGGGGFNRGGGDGGGGGFNRDRTSGDRDDRWNRR